MKTVHSQFKILVEFMERNGDLSKPTGGFRDRHWYYIKWQELTDKLNCKSTGGESRSEDKWRKVWSDFKNNTKKKWAKINSSQGTDSGTTPRLLLSDMEKRVLDIIAAQNSPVDVAEVGLDQVEIKLETDIKIEALEEDDAQDTEALVQDDNQDTESLKQDDTQDTEPTHLHSEVKEKLTTAVKSKAQPDKEDWNDLDETGNSTPSASTSCEPPPPKRRRKIESKIDYVARKFLESDRNMREFWRERERERIRQREIELRLQERWIDTMQQALDIFKTYLDK